MFKIININGFDSITCDSTIITVDSTVITVDMTMNGSYEFRVPYRFFSENIKFFIYDEFNKIESELECITTDDGGYMKFFFDFNFLNNKTYESRITDVDDKLIWRGKIFATDQTDLQNYKVNKNNRDV